MGLSQGLIGDVFGGASDEGDGLVQPIVTALYFVYCIFVLIGVHRVRASLVLATIMPLLATTADVAFVMAMEWCDLTYGSGIELETAAVSPILNYSLLRQRQRAWYSLFLSIVAQTSSSGRALHWTVILRLCALRASSLGACAVRRPSWISAPGQSRLSRRVSARSSGRTEALLDMPGHRCLPDDTRLRTFSGRDRGCCAS
jgi:hypothetical protein